MLTRIRSWLYDTHSAEDHLKVASVTISIDPDSVNNLRNIANQVDVLLQTHPDIELVVFGEMLLGWFRPGKMPEYHQGIARPISQKMLQSLMERCKQYGIYLCFGMPESDEGVLYNAQLLINSLGDIQAVHRKWNLKPDESMANYRPGLVPMTITEIKNIKTGILICADAAHPKTIWSLLRGRLDMIILSLADDRDEDWFMAKSNARMYDAWVVTANRFGNEDDYYWNGHTVISNPLGSLMVTSKDRAGYLIYDIKIDRNQFILKRILRNILVKTPLLVHLISNLNRFNDYR